LSEPGVLAQVMQVLDDSPVAPRQTELDALFEQLRPGTLGVVLGWLKQAQHPEVRAALERTATRLASANTGEMLKLMLAEDPAVATEAMRRAADLKTPAAVTQLARVLAEGAVALRQEAVQALVAIGSPGAFRVLESALDDADREVRMLAVRAIGARGHRNALAKIEAVVKGRGVRDADLTEKMAFFEAYGQLAGAEGIALLDEMLSARSLLLRRRVDPDIRACAARALGKIGTPAALEVLRRSADDNDVRVRSEINRALRGGES
jgi:HEAT repeat protein